MKTIELVRLAAIGGVLLLSPICMAQETNKLGATNPEVGPWKDWEALDLLPYGDISNTNRIDRDVFFFSAPDVVVKKSAQDGDPIAQFALGHRLMKEGKYSDAIIWLDKAAHSGSVDAQFLLELVRIFQKSKQPDLNDAWQEIRNHINNAAVKNVPYAQWALGESVPQGDFGYTKDEKLGYYWCSRSASNGLCLAMASMAKKNSGRWPDEITALNWYLKLTDKGEVLSGYNAAIILITMAATVSCVGDDVGTAEELRKQLLQARSLLHSCKEKGLRRSADDILEFLEMLSTGQPPKIIFDQKKKPHNVAVLCRIAQAFDPGMKSARMWDYVAEPDSSKSVCDIVSRLALSLSIFVKDRNKTTAIRWYKLAAENGDASAATTLGTCFEKGNGVQIDKSEARKWYLVAARKGNVLAQWLLGDLIANDFQDYVEAYKWLNISIANDQKGGSTSEPWALDDLKKLEKLMTPQQILEAQRQSTAFLEGKPEAPEAETGPRQEAPLECKSCGTGFFITPDGYCITACHVIHDAARVEIKTKTGKVKATIIRTDPANDIAVLKADGQFASIPLDNSKRVKLGDTVITIGFPNPEIQGFSPKLTKGEIGSLFGIHDDPRHFQISAPIQPGNSGGPLLNASGNAIGTLVSRLSDRVTLKATGMLPQNVNYALKGAYLLAMVEAMPDISEKLVKPRSGILAIDEIVKDTEPAIVMILVY